MMSVAFNIAESFYRGIGYPYAAVINKIDVLAYKKAWDIAGDSSVDGCHLVADNKLFHRVPYPYVCCA